MVCYEVWPVFVVKVKVVVVVVDRRDFEIQSSVLQLERSVGGGWCVIKCCLCSWWKLVCWSKWIA